VLVRVMVGGGIFPPSLLFDFFLYVPEGPLVAPSMGSCRILGGGGGATPPPAISRVTTAQFCPPELAVLVPPGFVGRPFFRRRRCFGSAQRRGVMQVSCEW